MQGNIRRARPADVETMVGLSEQQRIQCEAYQPVMWRKAEDSWDREEPVFAEQIRRERTIALVHEQRGAVDGFIVAELTTAPPVYAPGGYLCQVHGFSVAAVEDWETVGSALLKEVCREARRRGAVLATVEAAYQDEPRRTMLADAGFEVASELHVKPIAKD